MPTKPTGRPRGRPPGSKNIPKIEDFVAATLAGSVPVPTVKPKGKPRGPWAGMTPEERSAYSKALAAKKTGPSGGRLPGIPRNRTKRDHLALVAQETPIVEKIVAKMIASGELEDDPDVVEAFKQAGFVLRTQEDWKAKLAAGRLILDFKKAKPTSKVEHTIKTAEDYLDELAEDDDVAE